MSHREEGQRLVDEVVRVSARAQQPLELLRRVATLIRRRVPYEAAGWVLVDPETLLLTGVHAENVTREQHLALIECEQTQPDLNRFVDLARSEVAAASLSAVTGGDLRRSTRYRTIYEPAGYGDELRAVFRSGGTPWGSVCLTRAAGQPAFTDDEVALVARVAPHVAEGIRTSLGLGPLVAGDGAATPSSGAALVVLTDDGSVETVTPEAAALLGPLEDETLETTIVVHEVAQRARLLADGPDGGRAGGGPPAHARARTRHGGWVVVRGARLADVPGRPSRTAVVLERARPSDVAALVLRLRRLTPRERDVAELLLAGLSTREIAERLWITPETLRGHVKAVLAKVGVGSRPELAAVLLQDGPPTASAGPQR